MRAKLSDKLIQNAKPPAGATQMDVWDSILPGFGLRVGARKKSFVAMVRVGGVKRRITLGDYPAMTLAAAREKAREAMEIAERGDDPNRAVEQERAARDTVGNLVADFIEKHCKKNNRDWRNQASIFEHNVLPHWRHRQIGSIRRRDCIELLDKAAERTSPVNANRVRAHVSKFFNWAVGRDVVDANPMLNVPRPGKEASRDRALGDDEIRAFWCACDGLGYPFGQIFKLLLVTAQRRDEVGAMRWAAVDLQRGIWTVPAELAKNGVANEVPLSALAAEILASVPKIEGEANSRGYLFPATNGSGNPASGYSKAKLRCDRLMIEAHREACGLPADDAEYRKAIGLKPGDKLPVEIPDWWLHDLRRTAASAMAQLGIAPHVIEKVLNHVTGQLAGVAGIYNRHGYLPEKRHALETWASHLRRLLDPAPIERSPSDAG